MAKKDHDILIAALAADLTSPRVVAAIDNALEEYRQASLELMDLRKMAVRRHGEPLPNLQRAPEAPRSEAPSAHIEVRGYDGSLTGLIQAYLTDARSPYPTLRHATRQNYATLLKRIKDSAGPKLVADLKTPDIQHLYESWSAAGKVAMAHSLITMLRSLITFGATVLKDDGCERLSFALHRMKFKMPEPQSKPLTAEQAALIIARANDKGLPSMALAQAIQFDCMLRQKDVIGEWVPISDQEESDIVDGDFKWVRGIRWEQIDQNGVLHHVTSKEEMPVEISLRNSKMVMNELAKLTQWPQRGPIIVSELTRIPWTGAEFRRQWRKLARACGIPDDVKNRSRSGPVGDDGEE